MDTTAFLLAAGFGTRLSPLTDGWPKCLMPIKGVPLLEYWLQNLRKSGFTQVLINSHFHGDIVDDFLKRDRYFGWVNVAPEKKLLGTAGSLRQNAPLLNNRQVLLAHADNWCQINLSDLIDYHNNKRPNDTLMTMVTFNAEYPSNCGIVELDNEGRVIYFHEKVKNPPGNIANAAIYIIEPEVINWINNNPEVNDFSLQVIPNFIGKIATWHNSGIHRDIGTLEQLRLAQNDLIDEDFDCGQDEWSKTFSQNPIHKQIWIVG